MIGQSVSSWLPIFVFLISVPALAATPAGQSSACPAPAPDILAKATQLVVVTGASWDSSEVRTRLFQRATAAGKWAESPSQDTGVIGRTGFAWGHKYARLATGGSEKSPVKQEGDGRTPAGVYKLGREFGFEPGSSRNFLHIKESTVCVDDPQSRFYNTIVNAKEVQQDWRSSEKMREIDVYKVGFVVDYESSAKDRAGSCIFLHIAKPETKNTAGCLAINKDSVENLQKWIRDDTRAAIAFLPESEFPRWKSCFPGVKL